MGTITTKKAEILNNDPAFLQWLHELTVVGYSRDIVIPADHADVIQYIYLTTESIDHALDMYQKFRIRWDVLTAESH
ncbi:hypothetical protein J3L18_05490 [Mucilaginibacter gossypii]|uniref:hypothetical protein n=1 Tax=Mucilaginibacter gossypii TaxID=551996 RepID=UPI000DCC635E|nr:MULTISPECIES: hypothetical protein [Mucilaginibacter]QTE38532.1 hypothetical protein J3L18_05490 [Mucilaginibacter gossypii]RAV55734.1 hypothetical protein DIU36_16720 [Mucilaginibacter rubeus]